MLLSIKQLTGYTASARDENIGKIDDFYFDDRTWIVRYLIVDTGKWLPGRRVLVSPVSVGEADWEKSQIAMKLTKKQIEESPAINEDRPVSRQHELELIDYYQWPNYWDTMGMSIPDTNIIMAQAADQARKSRESEQNQSQNNPHLRSSSEVTGYFVRASNGEIGHIEDFIVEEKSWIIRYAVVDTKNWLPWGKKVLVSPSWIERINYLDREVQIDLSRELIENSPEFDAAEPINRKYEVQLYDFYGRPHYWTE